MLAWSFFVIYFVLLIRLETGRKNRTRHSECMNAQAHCYETIKLEFNMLIIDRQHAYRFVLVGQLSFFVQQKLKSFASKSACFHSECEQIKYFNDANWFRDEKKRENTKVLNLDFMELFSAEIISGLFLCVCVFFSHSCLESIFRDVHIATFSENHLQFQTKLFKWNDSLIFLYFLNHISQSTESCHSYA